MSVDWLSLSALALLLSLTLLTLLLLHLRPLRPLPHAPTATLVISHTPANHSPRALAHAQAAHTSRLTQAIIFIASLPAPDHPAIQFIPIPATPPTTSRTPLALLRRFIASASLLSACLKAAARNRYNVDHIILNTPPALPIIPIVYLHKLLYFPSAKFTIDWHNIAYTLMQLTSPPAVIPFARALEALSASCADNHWTVSKAMALFLRTSFSVSAKVIYDTPRPDFLKLAHANMHPDLRAQLFERVEACATRIGHAHIADELPIVITSTSWTPDEDFSLFFDALQQIDARKRRCTVVITGRGPLRAEYEERAHQMAFRNITLYFAWLHIEDYPRLLSLSTIGVSLHQSSSGLDLPMKAVDMLACGLPVLALRYHCIHELISHRRTGLLFHDAHGLAAMLEQLVFGSGNEIEAMRRNVREQFDHNNEWISYWQREALPTLVPNGRGNNT